MFSFLFSSFVVTVSNSAITGVTLDHVTYLQQHLPKIVPTNIMSDIDPIVPSLSHSLAVSPQDSWGEGESESENEEGEKESVNVVTSQPEEQEELMDVGSVVG